MKILIVSYEAWRESNNGGNVLSNVFSAFPDAEIAQIYCSGELPQNSICRKYFQISDSMLLKTEKGRVLEEKYYNENYCEQPDVVENRVKSRVPSIFKESALFAREMLWNLTDWKTRNLKNFVKDFNPDIIFAPCYSYFHVSKLALYVKSIAKCPMISYISDDNYSLRQFRLSPSFWINRLITRKWIRKLFSECAFVYTMTEMQKKEYEKILGCPMKILCKSAEFLNTKENVNMPVRFIYGGGLYLNRWKILDRLAEALNEINANGEKAQLHIYSNSHLSDRQKKNLDNRSSSFLHSAVSYKELEKKYANSDIAVHVESFDLKNKGITRLSFSTKIIDCMNSGCAILAIGPSSQAGIAYLKDNDAAVCVNNINLLYDEVNALVNDPQLIKSYADKAKKLGEKNHMKSEIEENLRQDFYGVISGDKI